jgi:hypothetical protein
MQTRNRREAGGKQSSKLVSGLAHSSALKMGAKYFSETTVGFNGLYRVVSQKTELFINTHASLTSYIFHCCLSDEVWGNVY